MQSVLWLERAGAIRNMIKMNFIWSGFFHSGCSVPFFAEIKFRGEESVIHFDPFSGYSLKTDK